MYFVLPAFREYIESVGLRRLTSIHILRISAAPLFFWYGAHRQLPHLFVDRAAWGDIAAGILALLAVTVWQRPPGYWFAHLFGMADFFVAFGTAITLARQDPAAVHAVTSLPMALIPFFGVGILATTHVMAYYLLLRQRSTQRLHQVECETGPSPAYRHEEIPRRGPEPASRLTVVPTRQVSPGQADRTAAGVSWPGTALHRRR